MGLDWPSHTYDHGEQKRTLKEIIERLKEAKFNTIYFQVRGRADAMYRSAYEPWSQQLTGILGEDPGWDPLSFVIDEAHAHCMEVHAWFNTFLVKTGGVLSGNSIPRHIMLTHPEWIHQVNGEWWFDPGLPEVRAYNIKVALDIVRKYNIDGFQFDYIRYPGRPLSDDATYKKYGRGIQRDEWRRDNVNQFIKAFNDSARAVKPYLKIGATPIGIYKNISSAKGQQSYSELFQDSRRWLREKWIDYLVPQVYWTLGSTPGDPDFSKVIRDWMKNSDDRQTYIGIGAYKPEVLSEVPRLVDSVRSVGLPGVAFFRYENIKNVLDLEGRFPNYALIPSMPWKDSIPPNPPLEVKAENIVDGIFSIRWNSPERALDGDRAKYYCIYRSSTRPVDVRSPENLISIILADHNQYTDTISHVRSIKYYYAVSAIDKGNNESKPTFESIIIPEIAAMAKTISLEFKLGRYYRNSESSTAYFPYTISEVSPVSLKIIDSNNREMITLVNTVRSPGLYIASANISKLEDGEYTYLLRAGNLTKKKTLTVNH